jgi:hypothetical protein
MVATSRAQVGRPVCHVPAAAAAAAVQHCRCCCYCRPRLSSRQSRLAGALAGRVCSTAVLGVPSMWNCWEKGSRQGGSAS